MKFYENLQEHAKRTAVLDKNYRTVSYGELLDAADALADHFSGKKKSLVFILCENRIEMPVGYLAVLRTNQAALLIQAEIDGQLLNHLCELYSPDYIWQPQGRFPFEGGKRVHDFEGYELVFFPVEREFEIHGDLNLLLSTSGSTGSPKLVKLTGANLDANAVSIAEYLGIDNRERPVTSLPLNYSYGLSVINSHFLKGATILLTDDTLLDQGFWEFMKTGKASSFAGVPYMYEMLKRLKFFDRHLPDLKTLTQAGGKLNPVLVKEFAEFSHGKGIDFYVMYGQTEATARISYLPPEKNIEKYKSMGIAIPGGKLSIVDDDGRVITEARKNGEFIYEGPNVMMGYAECAGDLAKGDELGGVLKTGDIGYFDEEGFFYVTGRKKRFIKMYGDRVSLDMIEHHLKSLGYSCICGGKDDLLCVATTDKGNADKITGEIREKYKFNIKAIKIIHVDEFEKSSSGKILYKRIFKGVLD